MKKILSVLLCFAFCLGVTLVCLSVYKANRRLDPPGQVSIELGNAWTTVWESGGRSDPALTVTNRPASAPVMIRFVDAEHILIVDHGQTILPGGTAAFSNLPTDGYILQAKSANDLPREYTLVLEEEAPLP